MLSELQKHLLAILGKLRDEKSYVAGGSALNVDRPRISHDIDIFHDAEREVVATAQRDIVALREAKFAVSQVLMQYGIAEVVVKRGTEVQGMGETVLHRGKAPELHLRQALMRAPTCTIGMLSSAKFARFC